MPRKIKISGTFEEIGGGGGSGNATVPEPYVTSPGAQQFVDAATDGIVDGLLLTPKTVTVSGAGEANANGVYVSNGSPYQWVKGDWMINFDGGSGPEELRTYYIQGEGLGYMAGDAVADIGQVPSWLVIVADTPVPTVTCEYVIKTFKDAAVGSTNIIRPEQAFVNTMSSVVFNSPTLEWGNKGITGMDLDWAQTIFQGEFSLNLAGNDLDQTTVDGLLARLNIIGLPLTLNISEGTSAEPTGGAANTDLIGAVGSGCTVTVNISGTPTTFP